jgi:hypothetical protein
MLSAMAVGLRIRRTADPAGSIRIGDAVRYKSCDEVILAGEPISSQEEASAFDIVRGEKW